MMSSPVVAAHPQWYVDIVVICVDLMAVLGAVLITLTVLMGLWDFIAANYAEAWWGRWYRTPWFWRAKRSKDE